MITASFNCNLLDTIESFPHFWEHTVGSCHATMALRADYQKQLTRCHKELGFRHVRFHGILSDDMGTLVDEMDQLVYSFFNADQICDFLLSIGMKPFIELSFMPSTLSSGADIVFHYKGNITPPHDYDLWESFIFKLVQHWVDRYGIEEINSWFFEVWNEPNLTAFWTGSQDDYFKLYKHTVQAIKRVGANIQVGGPATADNAWVPEFLDYCEKNGIPADFISTHHYPTDDFGQPGDDTIAELAASHRSALREEVAATKAKARNKPIYYTEWSTSSNPFDEMHDQSYAAAFIVKTVMEAQGYVDGYSYWTFSDIFEENYFSSLPFHGGFGLMNIYGVPKPAYRAFEMLHKLSDKTSKIEGSHETVDAWLLRGDNKIQLLLTNWALPRHEIKIENITMLIKNVGNIKTGYVERIDDTHANAYNAWLGMGNPTTLSAAQVATLEEVSKLNKELLVFKQNADTAVIKLTLSPQAVACITLEIE